MNVTYYEKLKFLNDDERSNGLKRLGRVLKASREIQSLTGRDFFTLSEIFYDVGVSATHVGDIEKGHRMPRETTIHRLVPFCFEVDHFEFIGDDKVGIPHFKYRGETYTKGSSKFIKIATMCLYVPNGTNEQYRPKPNQLPDSEYRCKNIAQLVDIITGGIKIRSVFTPDQSTRQKNTPTLSLG